MTREQYPLMGTIHELLRFVAGSSTKSKAELRELQQWLDWRVRDGWERNTPANIRAASCAVSVRGLGEDVAYHAGRLLFAEKDEDA